MQQGTSQCLEIYKKSLISMTEIRTYTVKTKEVKNQLKVIFCDCDVHLQK